jgi:predicted neutral ceramidase superfamily lipid hydrolase
MMILALISLLAGAALGMRFKVLVLVPAIGFILLVAAGTGLGRGDSLGTVLLMAAAAVTSLQIGYFGGGIIRYVMATTRMGGLRTSQAARRGAH